MTFLAVGWLALVVPWLMAAAWLWRRDPPTKGVTARFLWQAVDSAPSDVKQWRRPPIWVLLALAGSLCVIVAMAQPVARSDRLVIDVLIDPHLSSSAMIEGKTVAQRMADRVESELSQVDPAATVGWWTLDVDGRAMRLADPSSIAWQGRSDASAIRAWCDSQSRSEQLAIICTARMLDLPDSAIPLAPTTRPNDLAITHLAASAEPRAQAMVVVTHPPGQSPFMLRMNAGAVIVREIAPLPSATLTQVFIDIDPANAEVIDVSVESPNDVDALEANDRAWLVRGSTWPRVEVLGSIPDGARRFADQYGRLRPAVQTSSSITFSDQAFQGAGIVFAPATRRIEETSMLTSSLPFLSTDIAESIRIEKVVDEVPAGFRVILKSGEYPIVALCDAPARQMLVGFDVEHFSKQTGWVIWLSRVVEWLGSDDRQPWESAVPDEAGRNWTALNPLFESDARAALPGLYRDGDKKRAVNLPAIDWRTDGNSVASMLRMPVGSESVKQGMPLATALLASGWGLGLLAGLIASASRLDGKR